MMMLLVVVVARLYQADEEKKLHPATHGIIYTSAYTYWAKTNRGLGGGTSSAGLRLASVILSVSALVRASFSSCAAC